MTDINTHHLTVLKTARYATLGQENDDLREVGFVCHGYGHLAASFLESFAGLEYSNRLIVAPEGLSRFYLSGARGDIGASWMTRQDREHETGDYVNYLDMLYARMFKTIDRMKVRVFALGFSQGTATVSRWIGQGTITVDHLILWAGGIPPDLDLAAKKNVFNSLRLTIVAGKQDPQIDARRLTAEEERLKSHGVDYELVRYDGGHHLDSGVLEKLIASQS